MSRFRWYVVNVRDGEPVFNDHWSCRDDEFELIIKTTATAFRRKFYYDSETFVVAATHSGLLQFFFRSDAVSSKPKTR